MIQKTVHVTYSENFFADSSWYSLETLFNSKLLLDIFSVFQLFYEKSRKGKGKDDQYLFTCSNLTKVSLVKIEFVF